MENVTTQISETFCPTSTCTRAKRGRPKVKQSLGTMLECVHLKKTMSRLAHPMLRPSITAYSHPKQLFFHALCRVMPDYSHPPHEILFSFLLLLFLEEDISWWELRCTSCSILYSTHNQYIILIQYQKQPHASEAVAHCQQEIRAEWPGNDNMP